MDNKHEGGTAQVEKKEEIRMMKEENRRIEEEKLVEKKLYKGEDD